MSFIYICHGCWEGGEELSIGGTIATDEYHCAVCGASFSRTEVCAVREDAIPDNLMCSVCLKAIYQTCCRGCGEKLCEACAGWNDYCPQCE